MKPYRDQFGGLIPKSDVMLTAQFVAVRQATSLQTICRGLGLNASKAGRIVKILTEAGVVRRSETPSGNIYVTKLRNREAAVNAALRQLKKGKSHATANSR